MHITKDGKVKQPTRKWYSLRETLEIYEKGGHVVLTLKEDKNAKENKDVG